MQENRAFDTYFGTYPGASDIPANECMPTNLTNLSKPCVRPYLSTNVVLDGDGHGYNYSVGSWNNGLMNGFVVAEGNNRTMVYYNNLTIPYYWYFAKHYSLTNRMFSSYLSYSLPNHWYLIAANAPKQIQGSAPLHEKNSNGQYIYLQQANVTETVADLLINTSLSWKYYDYPLPVNQYQNAVSNDSAFNFWNPFASKFSSYTSAYSQHFVSRANIYGDIKNHTLPQISWIIPSSQLSEHPPRNITLGMIWTTSVVDAVMNSTYWNNTVVIIVWDDYGGFFDHVSPPTLGPYQLSFRVPGIIISPYARSGYIDNTTYSFESLLKLIEWRFNLQPLTNRDSLANNMLGAFNFTQAPQPPHPIPLTQQQLNAIKPYLGGNTTDD